MQFSGTLVAVSDMTIARTFYEDVLGQKLLHDFGSNIAFESGLSLQEGFAELIGVTPALQITKQSNSFELYFEVDDYDEWEQQQAAFENISYIHTTKEYPWGQRVCRFYDPDKHIIEVGEKMESVVRRYLAQGLSPAETSEKTMFPIEFVESLL